MNINTIKKLKGVTLVEVVIYLGIFAIIFVVLVQYTLSVTEFNSRNLEVTALDRSTILLNEHIEEYFKSSISIDTSNSTFNDFSGVLTLNTATTDIQYRIEDERIVFTRDGQNYFLTDEDHRVERFLLEPINNQSSQVVGIRVNVIIDSVKAENISKNTTTSYVID